MLKELIAIEKVKLDDAAERKLKVSVCNVIFTGICRMPLSTGLTGHDPWIRFCIKIL